MFHQNLNEAGTFLFTSESVGEGHPGIIYIYNSIGVYHSNIAIVQNYMRIKF
jgi:hypothetical protein